MTNNNRQHSILTGVLAVGILFVTISCSAQATEPDAVLPAPPQVLRNGGYSTNPDDVLKAFADERSSIRIAAAQVVGERRMTQAISRLQGQLADASEIARVEAARSLLLMGDSSGIPELQKLIRSRQAFVVTEAADVLAAAGDMSGFDEIVARLKAGKAPIADRIIFVDALKSFRRYEPLGQQVRSLLSAALLDDPSSDVRMAAAIGLETDPSTEAAAALAQAQQKETDSVVRGVLEANRQRRAAKREQQ